MAQAEGVGFLKDGDIWVMSGDSITQIDLYRQAVADAVRHFHPESNIRIENAAVWGQLVSEARGKGLELKPTVVSIMLGMNNVIHHDYPATNDFTRGAADYAESIRRQIRDYRAAGATVVLMTPTLTDETENSYFHPFHTREGLKAYARALVRVAREERCALLPMAEDFERFKPAMGKLQTLIPDGVHPYGWGQYAIARALIHRLGIARPLATSDGARSVVSDGLTLNDIRFARQSPFLSDAGQAPTVLLTASADMRGRLRWSVEGADARGEREVDLRAGEPFAFTPPVPAAELPSRIGTIGRLVLSVTPADGRPRLAIVDLARTQVYHFRDGKVSGEIRTAESRPEGSLVGTWTMEERGPDLWFSGRMTATTWPKRPAFDTWMNSAMMNGVVALFDFRPPERFAENSFDHDVNMVCLSVLEDPWSVLPLSWINRRVHSCLRGGAERTEGGYAWRLGFRGFVNDYTRFDITKHDYFGVYFIFNDDADGKMGRYPVFEQLFGPRLEPAINPERRLNQTAIFDRKGVIAADEVTTVGVFGL